MTRVSASILLAATLCCPSLATPQGGPPTADAIGVEVEKGALDAFELYRDLLRLPNDAVRADDMEPVIEWLREAFAARGFETAELETGRVPLLLAEKPAPGAEHTVLIYLQADGQPVDPSAWDQESPWEPVLKERSADGSWSEVGWDRLAGERDADWRIFARSASDSKGPIAQFLAALDVLAALDAEPSAHLKVIVDTEEELGSPRLAATVERERQRLAADRLVIFDGPPHPSGEPTLVFGARGIATITLTTYGPRVPQHSGHYGNYVPNPALRMAQLLASMKDADGRVTIPGFYDGVELTEEDRKALAGVPDDVEARHRALGIGKADAVAGSLQEAIQYPSLNIRGLSAGWVGDQARTIIPATATAEIDVRLVLESDAEKLLDLIREQVEEQGFMVIEDEPTEEQRLGERPLVRWSADVSYGAFRTPLDSDLGEWLRRALVRYHGFEPIRLRTLGGSIPISPFVAILGVPAATVPTVNPDNSQHSPNENLRVGDFIDGIGVMAAVLSEPL
jgi:acetylornithine deacetylase/succinyl-diaminopimelate desuccinylase-like protein